MAEWDEANDALVAKRKERDSLELLSTNKSTNVIGELICRVNEDDPYFYSTLPVTTFSERLNVAKLLQSKENDIEELVNGRIVNVKDFILSKASFVDKDGKQVTTPKLVLIDDAGNSVSVLAKVFIVEFLGLVQAFGLPPWEQPIPISAKMQSGNGTNRYYSVKLP